MGSLLFGFYDSESPIDIEMENPCFALIQWVLFIHYAPDAAEFGEKLFEKWGYVGS